MINNIKAIAIGLIFGIGVVFIYDTALEMYGLKNCMNGAQTITEVVECDMKYGEEYEG